jgi:hypothetical protein
MLERAAIGKTIHFTSDFWLDWSLPDTKGTITNIALDAAGKPALIYAQVKDVSVTVDATALLTIV